MHNKKVYKSQCIGFPYKDLQRESQKAEEFERRKCVQKALNELEKREEEYKKQHIRDKQEREDIAKQRKQENRWKLQRQILEANR